MSGPVQLTRGAAISALSMLSDTDLAMVVMAIATVRSTRGHPVCRGLYDGMADTALSLYQQAEKAEAQRVRGLPAGKTEVPA